MTEAQYDVCLSYASENRPYVNAVAVELRRLKIRVFYDTYEEIDLWGKDLYQHLDAIYRIRARYCVVFISHYYAGKLWTNHELRSAQARAFEENREYILPARFDTTEIPGVPSTVAYIDLRHRNPEEFAMMIAKKLGLVPAESVEQEDVAPVDVCGCDVDGTIIRGPFKYSWQLEGYQKLSSASFRGSPSNC